MQQQQQQQQQSSSRKPCVYMLTEGRCARADCRFVHDLKTIMCKYWLEGECIKGENCEFLHELIVEEPQASRRQHKSSFSSTHSHQSKSGNGSGKKSSDKEKIKVKKIEFKLDTEEFPALGGGGGGGSNATGAITASTTTDEVKKQQSPPSRFQSNPNLEWFSIN